MLGLEERLLRRALGERGQWVSFLAGVWGWRYPSLLIDDVDFHDREDRGLLREAQNPSGVWPFLDDLVVDASALSEVCVYAVGRGGADGAVSPEPVLELVARADFGEGPRTRRWRDQVNETGRVLLAVGPLAANITDTGLVDVAFKRSARFGVCGLRAERAACGSDTGPSV